MQAQANTGLGGDVNILEAMEMFKAVPDQVLPKYAQDPKLAIFAAAEMARRDDMRKRYNQRAQKPNKPVIAQLSESMAPSMPMMPPGMNAPQEQQPMQMAPSQQPQMQPQMAGLAGLMPEQRMAGGGMVAFSGGSDDRPVGGLTKEQEEEQRRKDREAMIKLAESAGAVTKDVLSYPVRQAAGLGELLITRPLRAVGVNIPYLPDAFYGGADRSAAFPYFNRLMQERGVTTDQKKPEEQNKTQQTQQPQQRQQVIAPQGDAAAQAPMGIEQIIAMGKKAMAGVPQIQTELAAETAARAGTLYDERQKRFPDQISPIMEQLKQFYGQQPSQADIQKAANRQIALAMMGSKDRNFLAGLAGGLQAGEDVKKSMGAENRAMQQASLQAQLAHAKYQDAIRRGDYDAADKAAREERTYRLQTQKLQQEQAMMPLEVGLGLARAMQPKGGGEKPINPLQLSKEMREVYAMPQVQAEIKAIKDKYNKMAETTLGFGGTGIFGSVPKTWREPGPVDAQGRKTESLGDKMRREQDDVLRRYASKFGVPYSPYVVPADDVQRYRQMGQGGR
jgi:hypothetical protein